MINPHREYPTTQKKGLLPWCRGWLGLVIGSFGSAGGVVDMPRVPDGRAGVGAVGRVGGTSKQLSTMQETAILGARSLLGGLGDGLGRGKNYIWVGGD
jgi:hypothetical protein